MSQLLHSLFVQGVSQSAALCSWQPGKHIRNDCCKNGCPFVSKRQRKQQNVMKQTPITWSHKYSHIHSQFPDLLFLPGDSFQQQATVKSGSRWMCLLSLQFYSQLRRQMQTHAHTHTHRPWGILLSLYPSISSFSHQFNSPPFHSALCPSISLVAAGSVM